MVCACGRVVPEAFAQRLEDAIDEVLRRANGQTPNLVWVGKDYSIADLRRTLEAALNQPHNQVHGSKED